MRVLDEPLEKISRSGEAVFAADSADRIILWNKACERLLSIPARRAIGKRCFEVLGGRDCFGNLYCHRGCAAAYQARECEQDPVHSFDLTAQTGDGKRKTVRTSLFAVPSYHAALKTLVHVLRDADCPAAPAPAPAAAAPATEERPSADTVFPVTLDGGETVVLTPREREILRSLAEGMGTAAIARKLCIASVTVRNHVQNILHKLDVHSKVAAVVLAYRHGLV